jgi:cell division GTPase FtsZ
MLIIGAGGAGTQIVLGTQLREVGHCVFVNTDAQSLARLPDSEALQIGTRTCAGVPAKTLMVGERAVRESLSELEALLLRHGSLVVAVAGLGGGTGTAVVLALTDLCTKLALPFFVAVTVPPQFSTTERAVALRALSQLRAKEVNVYAYDLDVAISEGCQSLPEVLHVAKHKLVDHLLQSTLGVQA